jgi:hypothetical protein
MLDDEDEDGRRSSRVLPQRQELAAFLYRDAERARPLEQMDLPLVVGAIAVAAGGTSPISSS